MSSASINYIVWMQREQYIICLAHHIMNFSQKLIFLSEIGQLSANLEVIANFEKNLDFAVKEKLRKNYSTFSCYLFQCVGLQDVHPIVHIL